MLAQSVMTVVFVPGESISLGSENERLMNSLGKRWS